MNDSDQMTVAVIFITVIFVSIMLFLAALLVINSIRRQKHRAEVVELQHRLDREVIQAEREATEATLSELGRELHDNVGQLLTAVQLSLAHRFEAQLEEDEQLTATLDMLDEGIDEVQRLGRSLNTEMWQHRNLFDAIGFEAARIERMGHGVVHIDQDGGAPDLSPDASTILFRTFQEVISNTLKHSEATVITIELQAAPLRIALSDNGKGFDPAAVDRGSGLYNIKRRCELIAFVAELNTAPGKGCQWIFKKKQVDGT